MPNIWAHIQFGREVICRIKMENLLLTPEWKNAFQLGCQGPDFLFYDNFLPWQSSTVLNRLGSLMHNNRCGPVLLDFFNAIRARPIEHLAVAYTIGFLLHHILDRHLHPFVFSRSGFKKWHHQRFETAMDSVILSERAGIHTGVTPVTPEVDTHNQLPGQFSTDFLQVVTKHYPVLAAQITTGQLDYAVKQFMLAHRLFFDPRGIRRKLTFGQITPFSPPRKVPDWDVLNHARKAWIDPCDRTMVHTESAMELWDNALQEATEMTQAGIAWLYAQSEQEETLHKARFTEMLKDISYETGRPCGSVSITYADSIVPVE